MTLVDLPGYRVVSASASEPEPGLRNDVAAFVGPTERGPLATAVRVTGRREHQAVFGGHGAGLASARAAHAYFANGGEVAWVVRVGSGGTAATGTVAFGAVGGGAWTNGPMLASLPGSAITLFATSVGAWANGVRVTITYRAYGVTGDPDFDVRVDVPREGSTYRTAVPGADLADAISASGVVAAEFNGPPVGPGLATGPAVRQWRVELGAGAEPTVDINAYSDATVEQAQAEEIAIVALPGLVAQLGEADHDFILGRVAASAAASQDRIVITTTDQVEPAAVAAWRARMRLALPSRAQRRSVAAYGPWVLAEDVARAGVDPYPATEPAGHVAGVIARLDRERGSGWSPANVLVADAVDLAVATSQQDQSFAAANQLNAVRCRIGGGIEIWGADTLDEYEGRFLAHRRLIHRIVRASRRVAAPLVFDTNGPILWFSVTRAISGVLMEAFRSGFLQGATPDQAYRVRCDESTMTGDDIDLGRVICDIDVAPATPMEFITLRLTIGSEGLLEVVER